MRPSPRLRHAWVFCIMLGLSACAMLLASLVGDPDDEPRPNEGLAQPETLSL